MSDHIDSIRRAYVFGVAMFDSEDAALSGWFSVSGSLAQRFSAPHELPKSIVSDGRVTPLVWISNAGWQAYQDQFQSVGFMRPQAFFRISLLKMSSELGINLATCDMREVVATLSKVIGRSWSFTSKAWEGIIPLERMEDTLLSHLNVRDVPDFAFLEPVMESSFQRNSAVTGYRYESGVARVALIPNRVRHVANILSYGIPSGAWAVRKDINTIDKALSLDVPVFVECDVVWRGAPLADLCAYGSLAFGKNNAVRQWVAAPELVFLAEHATEIKITSAAVWEGFVFPPQLPDLFFEDSFMALSYSAGIVADSFLDSLSAPRYSKKFRKNFHPVRAVWLRSVDRALSFAQAKLLSDEGLKVTQYGSGEVQVRAFPHEFKDVEQVAIECGFAFASTPGGRE